MYEGTAVLVLQKNQKLNERCYELDTAWIEGLRRELDACKGSDNAGKVQVFNFMVSQRIQRVADIGYEERMKFLEYLSERFSPGVCWRYTKAFDEIKRCRLECPKIFLAEEKIWIPPYETGIFYLPYHPDERVFEKVRRCRLEENLVWDFTLDASEKMKSQVYQMIHYLIENDPHKVTLSRQLKSLNRYYQFCVENGITDLELVEHRQVMEYFHTLKEGSERERYSTIVGTCRRELFLRAKEINWDAHVWYLERFHIQPERMDPSNPVVKLSFVEIEHAGNRKLVKDYLRYEIGTTTLAIKHLKTDLIYIKDFLIRFNDDGGGDVRSVSQEYIHSYLVKQGERNIGVDVFNGRLMSIYHFLCFLKVRNQIEKVPLQPEYYRLRKIKHHLDRSVEPEAANEILRTLHKLPEDRRLMYLHFWCLGLRISEVCTLKGNAYSKQNGDTWIQVYQNKIREYKRIPIPEALYELMQIYLKKHQIGPKDYVFQSPSGGAYRSAVFRDQMIRFCEENQFQGGEYLFKSHDYRHNVATMYYDNGVSLQGVRDYLGHEHEEMTQQYIDFMPKRIEKANDEFFGQHSLASCLRKGRDRT